jgi:hypothetical protein
MLTLDLCPLPATRVIGIYGPRKNEMPERARFLHPKAAASFLNPKLGGLLVVSDVFRTAESSLAAVKAGRGAQPPGYSAHNFGLAIDIDVDTSLHRIPGLTSKIGLDGYMEAHGWFCHRRDHQLGHESWHYTFLGEGAEVSHKVATLAGYTEARIVEVYGSQLAPDDRECQALLAKLGLYHGAIDGDIGPQSNAAIGVFQRGWNLATIGLEAHTRRTLAYVACNRQIVT